MHQIGRSACTQHLRRDARGQFVAMSKVITPHFDFYNQQYSLWGQNASIGDTMAIACSYDATLHPLGHSTHGGLSSNDEMCLVHVIYYPRGAVSSLGSHSYSMPCISRHWV
eukprot:scaffold306_cov525-Prasinococcus_capsulatus_cf.AAC.26